MAQALIIQEETGKRIGETLVAMGALNQRELTLFLADLLHMPVVDIRRDNPDPEALALIPEAVVREHMAVPIRLDDDGLHVAVPDQPSVSVRALLMQSSDHPIRFVLAPESDIQWAIDSSYRAIGGVDRLVEAFEAVEGIRKGPSETSEAATEVVADDAADRPGRHPHPHPGQAGPGLGRAHRTVARRGQGALPHRRGAQGGPDAPRRHGGGPGQPDQDHGGHEHRRAASSPGRPADDPDRRQGHRRPGLDGRHDLGREVRDADPRQEPVRAASARPRHAARHPRHVLETGQGPLRHGAVRRPDRKREDDHALRHPVRGRATPPGTS